MSSLKVCRICFATDCKVYSMADNMNLQQAYEELMGLMVENEEKLPPYLCPECARRLLTSARFRTRSLRARLVLLEAVTKHDCITSETIKSVTGDQLDNSALSVTRKINQYDLEIVHVKNENVKEVSDVRGTPNEDINMIHIEDYNMKDQNEPRVRSLHEEEVLDVKMENDWLERVNDSGGREASENSSSDLSVAVHIKTEKDDVSIEDAYTSDGDVSVVSIPSLRDYPFTVKVENNGYVQVCSNAGAVKDDPGSVDQDDLPGVGYPSREENDTSHFAGAVQIKQEPISAKPPKETVGFEINTEYCHLVELFASETVKLEESSYETAPSNEAPSATQPGEKPHSCHVCNKTFGCKSGLRKHLTIHSGVKPHTCDICNKSFVIKSKLNRHLLTHARAKQYSCEMCNQTFRVESNFLIHLRIHSGEKPYSCDMCDRAYRDRRDLRKHLIIHTGAKPYACDICKKAFNMRNKLVRHLTIHSDEKPYSCKVCSKCFREKSHLQRHIRTHTGDRPYTCDICNKSFTESGVLKKHLRIHSREKRYSCNICNKLFNSKHSLNKHLALCTLW